MTAEDRPTNALGVLDLSSHKNAMLRAMGIVINMLLPFSSVQRNPAAGGSGRCKIGASMIRLWFWGR